MRRALLVAVVVAAACGTHRAPTTNYQQPTTSLLPARAERAIDVLLDGFDRDAAMAHVEFMSRYWRLAGNEGFDKSIDRFQERLAAAGFADDRRDRARARFDDPLLRVHAYTNNGHGWDHSEATVAILNPDGSETVVLSKEKHRFALCINSFSTPQGGRVLRLVDVGAGAKPADYEGKNFEDAIVIGDAGPAMLWRMAMPRGAAGVVSTALPDYISPVAPGAPVPPRDEWDILQWSSVPYDAERKGFGFKASPRAAAEIRRALKAGDARARVSIQSSFTERDSRMLIAEIPGAIRPDERIVIAAHVQEPGANDNASGSATLVEMAVAMRSAIREGRLPRPGRTITFLWIDEISGSRRWLDDFPEQAKQVKWMFSLDMTGEDVSKTGGTFLVERWPDPGAVYDRAWDPHSEWGRGDVDPKTLRGDLINDLHLAICRRVGDRTGWEVRSNPYEGGSDHTVFGSQGIPSLLDWHFTDRNYHTNFDTVDKVSPAEMRNVATAVGATAWLMASATAEEATEVATLVRAAGDARLARERAETAADRDVAVAAWEKWYREAVASASTLPVERANGVPPVSVSITPVPGIVVDPPQPARFRLLRETILFVEDRRAAGDGDYDLLTQAASHVDAEIRALAIRALGRLEQAHPAFENSAVLIQRSLIDADAQVRRTAAYALAQSVAARDEAAHAPRRAALLAALPGERDALVAAAFMESAARLADAASAPDVEAAVLARVAARPGAAGVASALEVLSRRVGSDGRLGAASLAWLASHACDASASPESRRLATQALLASSAIDATLATALYASDDWQVRRMALIAQPDALAVRALEDRQFNVRQEALRRYARGGLDAERCAPVLAAVSDANAHVSIEAIDALAACPAGAAVNVLADVGSTPGGADWHRASHALVSLAQIDSTRVRAVLPRHLADAGWPVRVYAARAALHLGDDGALEKLAGDPHSNVREAALQALRARAVREKSDAGAPDPGGPRAHLQRAILAALSGTPAPQAIRAAALAVDQAPDPAALAPALREALAALDARGADTTIDARIALIAALNVAAPGAAVPAAPAPGPAETPSLDELHNLPVRARIEMARGGAFEIELLPEEAAATVARFARLSRAGYFNGLTFHRVVANFVVQGGSPTANEYDGAARFQRDELGFARHERGAVGISTRGRDTGDAQIFIDLVDLPRLNHEYTVFGRVVSGMEVVDAVLEADVIQRISILK